MHPCRTVSACLSLWFSLVLPLGAVPVQTLPRGEPAGPLPPQLMEASGLAFSLRSPGVLWLNNDSGAPAMLQAIATDGKYLGSLIVSGVNAKDWEDCASFLWEGKPCLLIADVGDNDAKRSKVSLLVVPEPELGDLSPTRPCLVEPLWKIELRYPDGPRDCESVAVDLPAGRILLLSKRTKSSQIYSVPLRPVGARRVVATRVGELGWLERPTGLLAHPYGGQPTGFSISSDGLKAAILCYDAVWTFERKDSEDWVDVLSRPGRRRSVTPLTQAEAVGLDPEGGVMIVAGEGLRAPLLRYELKGAD